MIKVKDKNMYIMDVNMDNENVEEIAREAAKRIAELFDRLIEERENSTVVRIEKYISKS